MLGVHNNAFYNILLQFLTFISWREGEKLKSLLGQQTTTSQLGDRHMHLIDCFALFFQIIDRPTVNWLAKQIGDEWELNGCV